MRVLLIGGEQGRLARLAQRLRRSGHAVDRVEADRYALVSLQEATFDLAVVDLSTAVSPPDATVARLRRRNQLIPLVALTGTDDPLARIGALDAGADDCISPAQSDEELLARLRVWHRRGLGSADHVIQIGPLSFDTRERTVQIERQTVHLSHRELSLLEALIRRAGRYVDARLLLEQLFEWNEEATLNSVQVYISRLRRKIRHQALRLDTARGIGYCLDAVQSTAAAS